jgi:hypothetical protein
MEWRSLCSRVSRMVNGSGDRRKKEVRCLYIYRLLVSGDVTSRPYAGPAAAVLEARVGSRTAPLAAAGRGAGGMGALAGVEGAAQVPRGGARLEREEECAPAIMPTQPAIESIQSSPTCLWSWGLTIYMWERCHECNYESRAAPIS